MKATILCYHKVGTLAQEGKRLNVAPENLRDHVRFFTRKKIRIFLAREFISFPPAYSVCFTFDDAYRSTLENAPEILESHGARGSFFAVSSKVGQTSDWDGELARPLADVDELIRAQGRGHEIGNHSRSHPRMAELSVPEQQAEIVDCHEALLGQGIHCSSFCYPYGSYNEETPSLLRALGYEVGLSLKKGNVGESDSKLELPRIAVGFSDRLPHLLYKIHIRPKLRAIGL